jgi:RNA polymerase sigma-70 factor (ECF subfamily)
MLTEDDLLRFRAGESDAVRAVYREYGRLVYAVCRNQLGSAQLAEEAAQQTFLKAWKSAGTVEPGRDLAPWLATIARRTAIDVYRQELREKTSAIDDVSVSHPAMVQQPVAIEQTYDVWQVRQALDELPEDERAIVQLQHLEGLTQTAVAQRLNLPVGTVKSRSYRAHRKLAGRLGHLREGFDPCRRDRGTMAGRSTAGI